ncbi:hypothetical protein COJ99_07140 [Bacillus cereus]|uniref:hypothetical protein n=1 Tax=Bacillus cereus TaxID=1396 RepID=UPI000BF5A661|nr:hypothetical protein [Bacillus cereus]PFP72621.1 hypothetical protein COJ99_07140 [Bacillus cereus]
MRHTRNRQLAKAHKDPLFMWMNEPTDKIELQRYWMKLGLEPILDKSFKWHRKYNKVSYVNFIRWYVKIK